MTEKPTQVTAQQALSDSQMDVAEYAVTGLSIVINQANEKSPTAELATTIRDDFRKLRETAQPSTEIAEKGWDSLQKLSSAISQGQDVPASQASNLLVVMAGVASAVSTAGLVKAPEREVEVAPSRQPSKPVVGRWTRSTHDRAANPTRGQSQGV